MQIRRLHSCMAVTLLLMVTGCATQSEHVRTTVGRIPLTSWPSGVNVAVNAYCEGSVGSGRGDVQNQTVVTPCDLTLKGESLRKVEGRNVIGGILLLPVSLVAGSIEYVLLGSSGMFDLQGRLLKGRETTTALEVMYVLEAKPERPFRGDRVEFSSARRPKDVEFSLTGELKRPVRVVTHPPDASVWVGATECGASGETIVLDFHYAGGVWTSDDISVRGPTGYKEEKLRFTAKDTKCMEWSSSSGQCDVRFRQGKHDADVTLLRTSL